MRSRNGHTPPEACPLCNETTFEDSDWGGAKVRVFDCGVFFDCHVGVLSFRYLVATGARDVATEHFQRQLAGTGLRFVGTHDVW